MVNSAVLNQFKVANSPVTTNNRAKVRKSIPFSSNKSCVDAVKLVLENDSKQALPFVLEVKKGFLERLDSIVEQPVITNGITGESCSGKTTLMGILVSRIRALAGEKSVTELPMDSYYKDFSDLVKKFGGFRELLQSGFSLDVPNAFNLKQFRIDLEKLRAGIPIKMPEYIRNNTGVSIPDAIPVNPVKFIISEGIFNLHPEVNKAFDIKYYIETPKDVIKNRWHMRAENDPEAELHFRDVMSKADEHIRPTKSFADLILNGQASTQSAQNFIQGIYRAIRNP